MADVWAIAWKASFNIVAKEEMLPKLGQVGSMISVELNGPWMAKFPHGRAAAWVFQGKRE
jgi:hypothetical protein